MTFSRSHAGMIGIISLFTGMIAPVLWTSSTAYPFPLTDLQTWSYILLFLLALSFYLVSIRNWRFFRIIASIIVFILVYMFIISLTAWVYAGLSGDTLDRFYWWWIFIIIGLIALSYTIVSRQTIGETRTSIFSDTIIGIVGTLTLLWLSALIIAASIGIQDKWKDESIISKTLGSGNTINISWVTMSPSYGAIHGLHFERKNDTLTYLVPSSSGSVLYPSWRFYTGSNLQQYNIGNNTIIQSDAWTWIDGEKIGPHSSTSAEWGGFIIWESRSISIYTEDGIKKYKNTSVEKNTLTIAEWTHALAWISNTLSGYVIQKEWKTISEYYPEISHLTISSSGYDTLAMARNANGALIVVKNGIPIENIRSGYVAHSWQSNGSHSIYITDDTDIKRVIYDGVSIGREFDEVREIFLEKNGNSYAFFARPAWEQSYCLITRFRGNICGLVWYMNPRLGADGASLIYAWLKDGIWGIYRNADILVRDTGYASTDNSWDYLFFDITNPKQYMFIVRQSGGTYQLKKNGKTIPWIWKDVWLDATFWYDNKIIMTAQDDTWWRVIEF